MMEIIEQLGYLFGYGSIAMLTIFTITWLVQLKTKNAAIVDSVWAFSFPILAAIYFLATNHFDSKRIVLLAMVYIWGTRLGQYLLLRTIGRQEDLRYTALRKQWGANQNLFMLRFFYFQGLLSLVLSIPFALAMIDPSSTISTAHCIGVAVWVMAVVGESIADNQLKNFKRHPQNQGKICQSGIWNYSRHPNYFFEWLVWVSYFVFALGSPWGWLSVVSPAAILYFLLKVTGIPYTEQQMVKSRGQAFIDYQRTTSAFIPLPKKSLY